MLNLENGVTRHSNLIPTLSFKQFPAQLELLILDYRHKSYYKVKLLSLSLLNFGRAREGLVDQLPLPFLTHCPRINFLGYFPLNLCRVMTILMLFSLPRVHVPSLLALPANLGVKFMNQFSSFLSGISQQYTCEVDYLMDSELLLVSCHPSWISCVKFHPSSLYVSLHIL